MGGHNDVDISHCPVVKNTARVMRGTRASSWNRVTEQARGFISKEMSGRDNAGATGSLLISSREGTLSDRDSRRPPVSSAEGRNEFVPGEAGQTNRPPSS
jgi:hypothetical protein